MDAFSQNMKLSKTNCAEKEVEFYEQSSNRILERHRQHRDHGKLHRRGCRCQRHIVPCAEMTPAKLAEFDVVAFGCPAMGAEQLEESEFEPMFAALEGSLNGKKIALFGSYGWGDGQWMRDWAQRAQDDGAQLLSEEGLICNETPDDDVQAACRKLGADLAAW